MENKELEKLMKIAKDGPLAVQDNLDKHIEEFSAFKGDVTDKFLGTIDKLAGMEKLKGDKGDKGDQGEPGLDGKDGIVIKGIDGKDGKNGIDGLNGLPGKDGLDGKDGKDGQNGKDGIDGKDGSPDTPDEVVEKINKSSLLIAQERISGLVDTVRMMTSNAIAGVGVTTTNFFKNGGFVGRAKNINIIEGANMTATMAQSDDQMNITLTGTDVDTGYVPYVGATSNVVLGTHSLEIDTDVDTIGIIIKDAAATNERVMLGHGASGDGFVEVFNNDNSVGTLIEAGTVTTRNVAINGTAGTGFITLVAQASNPSAPAAGTLLLHSATTQGFTRMEQDNEAATNLVYGRDNVFIAKNTSGSTINKGQVVYVSGSTGNVPNIALAKADSATTLPSVAVALDSINNNAFGQVMTVGIISSVDTSAFSTGDRVYVSTTTAGALTNVRPSGTTNFVQRVGSVLVSGVGNGSLMIMVAPALLNMETGTNAATWTGSAVVATTFNGNTITTGSSTFTGSAAQTYTFPTSTDTIVGRASTDTLTNKRITKRVITASDATSITPNSDNADVTYQLNTQATGTLTINADAGTPTNGQSWLFKIKSTNVQTYSWNAIFKGGTTALPTVSTGGGKIDYYSFIYDTVTPAWHYTGTAAGF